MFEPARVWSHHVTIDPRMLANPGRMKTPPNREKMLRMRPGDARRIDAIERRANHLVTPVRRGGGLRNFTGDRKEDWLNEGASKKSPPKEKWADIRKIFQYHGETLLASDEGGLLREIGESLDEDDSIVPKISRVVCFGMGSFVDEEGNVDPAACKRYVGAADLAVVLMGEPAAGEDGKPRFEVYVSEPELSKYEIDFLISHGLQILNPYLHEGYYLIDSNTLVFGAPGVDPSLRLEQMILEFSRPAVIMMAPSNYRWNHDLWKQLDQQRRDAWSLLWKEYDYDGMMDPNEGAVQTKGYEIFPSSIAHYSLDTSNTLKPRAVLKAEADGRHPIHRGNYSYDLLGPFWGMHTWVRKAEFAPGPIVHDEPAPILVNEKEEYEVDRLMRAMEGPDGDMYYVPQLTGRPYQIDVYYPAESFCGAPRLIEQIHRRLGLEPPPRLRTYRDEYLYSVFRIRKAPAAISDTRKRLGTGRPA